MVSTRQMSAKWVVKAALVLNLAAMTGSALADEDLSGNSVGGNILKDGNADCECYAVTSDYTRKNADNKVSEVVAASAEQVQQQVYFTYHRFFDFRQYADTSPTENGYRVEPATVTDSQDQGNEPIGDQYSGLFSDPDFLNDWGPQSWGKNATADFPVRMQNSLSNLYLSQDENSTETQLTLRTLRLKDFQSAGEIENRQKNLLFASIRFKMRVRGAAGAVAGLFTYADATNEADIEILTDDKPEVWRFSNQPVLNSEGDEITGASLEAPSLPAWDDWTIGRIDWLPKVVRFYVNDVLAAENIHSVPRVPSGITLNMWSDGGVWSGNMTVGNQATLDIAWMEMVFNTSGAVKGVDPSDQNSKRDVVKRGSGCTTVCSIDQTDAQQGVPVVVHSWASSVVCSSNLVFAIVLLLSSGLSM